MAASPTPPLPVSKYNRCRPSGRNVGYANVEPSRRPFTPFRGEATPPMAETCRSSPPLLNTMTPSAFHVPPAACGAAHSVVGEPSVRSSFLSWPPEKYPMDRLSADQK